MTGLPAAGDVFHEGERRVQVRTGERDRALRHGRMITADVPSTAARFLAERDMLVIAAHGTDARLWVSLWFGEPGLIAVGPSTGEVSMRVMPPGGTDGDPVAGALGPESAVGILGIELATRRRVRVNGIVTARHDADCIVAVGETWSNCTKYIHRRAPAGAPGGQLSVVPRPGAATTAAEGPLDRERIDLVRRADTAFVGTRHEGRGIDASHRGGPVGFIEVVRPDLLLVPDYPGNSMFQTMGNMAVDTGASLTVVDFDARRTLAMTGWATVRFDCDPGSTLGTGRGWSFAVEGWVDRPLMGPEWRLIERFDDPAGA